MFTAWDFLVNSFNSLFDVIGPFAILAFFVVLCAIAALVRVLASLCYVFASENNTNIIVRSFYRLGYGYQIRQSTFGGIGGLGYKSSKLPWIIICAIGFSLSAVAAHEGTRWWATARLYGFPSAVFFAIALYAEIAANKKRWGTQFFGGWFNIAISIALVGTFIAIAIHAGVFI